MLHKPEHELLNALTRIGIVGRPNVGKSTLFNLLVGRRQALVKDLPGVTRDVQKGKAEIWGKSFEVMDTGGITSQQDAFSPLIYKKVEAAIQQTDGLIVVVDGRAGLCPEDQEVVRIAKKSGKDLIVLVNKVDREGTELDSLHDFYGLGEDLYPCSFEQRRGLDPLWQWLDEKIQSSSPLARDDSSIRIAVIGKPNAGKSSLTNQFLGTDRVIVSAQAGTTTDMIEESFEYDDRRYCIVDTAGLRRQSKRDEDIEGLAAYKSVDAIQQADLVLLVIDGTVGPSRQDARIFELAVSEYHKPVILVINKADIGEREIPEFRKTLRQQVGEAFHFFADAEICFVSAKTGKGIKPLLSKVKEIWDKLHVRIETPQLNRFFTEVIRKAPAPVHGTKNVRLYYLTQTQQVPPSFIAYANYPESVTPAYRRFLINQIKKNWSLSGIPVRLFALKRARKNKSNKSIQPE